MTDHIFLVDVGNALDLEHYDIYYFESMSRGTVSLFRSPNITEEFMKSIPHSINKILNRAPFKFDDYKIVFCYARRYSDNPSEYLCDLYLKNWISSCFFELREKTELIVIDYYNGNVARENELKVRYENLNYEMNKEGYLSSESEESGRALGFFPCESDLTLSLREESIPRFAKESGILSIVSDAAEGADKDESVKERYKSEYGTIVERNAQIKMMKIEFPKTIEETIIERLRLCMFILRNDEGVKRVSLEEQYENFAFDTEYQAGRLKQYQKQIEKLRQNDLENYEDFQNNEPSYERKTNIPDIEKNEEIGGDADLDKLMKRLFDITGKLNWEEEYFAVVDELESYEDNLEEYGKRVSADFHIVDKEKDYIEVPLEEASEIVHKELEQATQNFYEVRARDGDNYSTILDITNQFQRIHTTLKKVIERRRNGTWSRFLPIWIAATLMTLVPYLITQTYIVSGVICGSMIPIVCADVFIISFITAKYVVKIAVYVQLRVQMNRLKRTLKKYLDGLAIRQRRYHATINAMIGIFNAKSKLMTISEELSRQDEVHRKLIYHKKCADDMITMLHYFRPFFKDAVVQDENVDEGSVRIDLSKSVEDNSVYWI